MTTNQKCGKCGAALTAESPQGLCPACLLQAGLPSEGATQTSAGKSGSPDVLAVAEIAKRFPQLEILELLGAGGMGVVYKARQPQLDRLVALKVLPAEAGRDPAFTERFTREARALAKLSHPNIVAVYEFGQAGEFYYLIMEFVDGANLRQMERAGKLTAAQALAIVPKICDALQYAHDEGIVHRDIKPENILVDKKGRVKIADFGLAKLLGKERTDFTLTGTNQAMGTPHYMAPEQVEKPLTVDHRADIYSLGVVLYEMLTGELPIGRFQPPSAKVQVDVRLDEVVLRSMEHDVERRYQHVSEVKTAVEGVTSTPQATVAPTPSAIPAYDSAAAKSVMRPGWAVFLAGVGATFIGGTQILQLLIRLLSRQAGYEFPELPTLALAAGIVAIIGGVKMVTLKSHYAAVLGSVAAIVGAFAVKRPDFGLVALAVGIWALIVLYSAKGKAAFGMAPSPVVSAKPGMSPLKIVLIVVGGLVAVPVVIGLLVAALYWQARSRTRPSGPHVMLKEFTSADPIISKDFVPWGPGCWLVNCTTSQTYRLFEIVNPEAEACTLTYRVGLKLENLEGGRVYPEMWCRFPGRGEFFSRGVDFPAVGNRDGNLGLTERHIQFFLKPGEKPDLIRLNLVIEGRGRVVISNVSVEKNVTIPAAGTEWKSSTPAPDQAAWTSLFDGNELSRWRVIEDPERPQASGKVRVENGQIVLGEENVRAMAGVGWTGEFPTMDYEVEWEGMVQQVKDTQRIVMFPVGKDLPFVAIRGEAIEGKFGPVNGKQLEFSGATNQPPLLDGRWYPFRLRVSQAEGIGVWVDGHKVLSHRVTGFRFGGTMPVGPGVPKSLALGIDGPSAGGLRNIRMRSLPPSAAAKPSDLSPSEARALIPEAASMSFADFQKLTGSGDANVAKFANQSLSLVLLSLRMDEATKKNAAAMADFRYLEEAIHPAALVRAVSLSQNRGYSTMIQPDFITDCTCSASEGAATGVVSFRAEGLYAGKIEFLARWNNGAWQIDEFRLPGYGIKSVRGDDGRWVKSALAFVPAVAPAPKPVPAPRAALTADQIRLEDTAIRLLAAMRDKDEKAMREMATDSIIKTWPGALIYFAGELREKYQHEFEKPLALWPTETFIDGDFAVVRCTSKDTKAKLNDWYLGLIFYKTKDGAWRNAALAGATPDLSLAAFLADFKAKNLTPQQQQDALRAHAEQLLREGKYDEVITAVSKAIEQDPKNPLPWYRRATARALKAETANALADLKKAIELDPTLKSRAASDAFFKSLQDNAEFKNLTK